MSDWLEMSWLTKVQLVDCLAKCPQELKKSRCPGESLIQCDVDLSLCSVFGDTSRVCRLALLGLGGFLGKG